jgi:RNA polymerase sigma-70 factor (ECF subfamily)
LGWLRTIALRKSLDWRRRLTRRLIRVRELAREMRGAAAAPTYDARLEVESAVFQRALGRLSPKQRACLLLHDLEDLPFRSIAAEVGCNEATARVHYHRARERMRRLLESTAPANLQGGIGGQRV